MDYQNYCFNKREKLKYTVQGAGVCMAVGYLFFHELWGMLILMPYILIYLRNVKKKLQAERLQELRTSFRDALNSLSAALEAGYSAENAIEEARRDLKLIYREDHDILREFKSISLKLSNGVRFETALLDFAERSGVEDIRNFSEVFAAAKRTGGDMVKIIRTTRRIIGDKIEIKRELATLVAAKKFEVRILKLVPFGILIYFSIFSPTMLEPLYTTLTGRIIMLAVLVAYYMLCRLADRIMDIAV